MRPRRPAAVLCACGMLLACSSSPQSPPDAGSTSCVVEGPVVVHSGTLSGDDTWKGLHEVDGTFAVTGGTLTISPCSEIRMGPDASIELAATATALIAEGTANAPINFVRLQSTAPWGHLSARAPARISLAYARIEGGGTSQAYSNAPEIGASLSVKGDAASLQQILHVDHVAVEGSAGLGVFLDAARFATGSTQLTITNSGFYPMLLGADSLSDVPDGAYTGNAVDEILLQTAGLAAVYEQQRPILGDVTAHARGVPYRIGAVPASIRVGDGYPTSPDGKLTLEAGVQLRFTPQGTSGTSQILVEAVQRAGSWVEQGALVAQGTAAQPVVFTSAAAAPQAGDWQGLYFSSVVHAASRIDHAIIEYAGGTSYSTGVCPWQNGASDYRADAAVILFLQADMPPSSEFITNTTFASSAGAGVYRQWQATDVDFLPTNTFTSIAGCLQTNIANTLNQCPASACP